MGARSLWTRSRPMAWIARRSPAWWMSPAGLGLVPCIAVPLGSPSRMMALSALLPERCGNRLQGLAFEWNVHEHRTVARRSRSATSDWTPPIDYCICTMYLLALRFHASRYVLLSGRRGVRGSIQLSEMASGGPGLTLTLVRVAADCGGIVWTSSGPGFRPSASA